MQFTPINENDAAEATKPAYLLKPGECDFVVKQAEETTSQTTNRPMIKLTLEVWDDTGKQAVVYDYLMSGHAFLDAKFRHFAYTCGLGHVYESGKMDAEQCIGKGGRLVVRTKPQTGYQPKNEVADYVVADRTKRTEGYERTKSRAGGGSPAPTGSGRAAAWKAFCAATARLDKEPRDRAWRDAIGHVFGHTDQSKLTEADWQKMLTAANKYDPATGVPMGLRAQTPVTSPISDDQQFNEDDIPF